MVCGSRPRASAVAAAVQPWAKSQRACQRSRSRGVGARMSRRCNPLASISHYRRIRPISLTPIANPSLNPRQANQVHHQFTPCLCAFHLGFGLGTLQEGCETGQTRSQLAGLGQVVVGDSTSGGCSVVGAGNSHTLRPGQPHDQHSAGHHPVDELP